MASNGPGDRSLPNLARPSGVSAPAPRSAGRPSEADTGHSPIPFGNAGFHRFPDIRCMLSDGIEVDIRQDPGESGLDEQLAKMVA